MSRRVTLIGRVRAAAVRLGGLRESLGTLRGSRKAFGLAALALAASVAPALAGPNAPDITVALDGSGQFTSLGAAIESVRDYKPTRVVIYVKDGVYREKLVVPAHKHDITIIGESRSGVRLEWGDYAGVERADLLMDTRQGPVAGKIGTFRTSTVRIDGDGIRLESLTIVNTAGRVGQAVALHIEGDRCELRDVTLLGNQDTLFTGGEGRREYFRDCHIEGTTDFIFGPATALFDHCTLRCLANSYITAASTPCHVPYGYVFRHCQVQLAEGVDHVLLGRPWRECAAVAWIECHFPAGIAPVGWDNWRNSENEATARYREWHCSGPGADTTQRAKWAPQLTDEEASAISYKTVFGNTLPAWTPVYADK